MRLSDTQAATGGASGAAAPLPPVVRRFGWISCANDAASEMVTPLVPLLLIGPLGASAAVVGLVEGLAEAISQALKWVSGRWADRRGEHLRSMVAGYALSNSVRPLLGLAAGPWAVLVLRSLDRVGKGIRAAPRDALLAHAVADDQRGRAFGFQRALDHAGAAVGPLIAYAFLESGASLSETILWSTIPALLTLGFFVGFQPVAPPRADAAPTTTWQDLGARGRALVSAASLLALANLPEALLVVWLSEAGYGAGNIVLLWAVAHVAKSLIAYPAGALADRIGRRRVIATGWLCRAALLGLGATLPVSGVLVPIGFIAYCTALAASEGAERALIADAAPSTRHGASFGAYAALPGLAALPGGTLFGAVWAGAGASAAFGLGAVAALGATVLLLRPAARGGA